MKVLSEGVKHLRNHYHFLREEKFVEKKFVIQK